MSEYGQESVWRDTATADAERAHDLAARLECRARAEDEVAARDTYLGLLDIADGERVLDVGCGSGAVTRDIARRVGTRGLAGGLDPSPALLTVARELAQAARLDDRIEFREGDALRLPFPDHSLDAVVCVVPPVSSTRSSSWRKQSFAASRESAARSTRKRTPPAHQAERGCQSCSR